MQDELITLQHGDGGKKYHQLVENIFRPTFSNIYLDQQSDSAVCPGTAGDIALTTDSFVVRPRFFPGGNIGRLAVCGTVNDLAVSGATPKYLTVGMILEVGFPIAELKEICLSMAAAANEAGVMLVTGDTKVVEKGFCDGIYINTAGVGFFSGQQPEPDAICDGDVVLCSGTLGDHGFAVLSAREELSFEPVLQSDVAPLASLIAQLRKAAPNVRLMRDPTRGGVASVLHEWAEGFQLEFLIEENALPIAPSVAAAADLLGIDPLYMANEGKFLAILPAKEREAALQVMHTHIYGKNAAIIGRVQKSTAVPRVVLETELGTKRLLDLPDFALLPRIC